jgi:hypothetical protein
MMAEAAAFGGRLAVPAAAIDRRSGGVIAGQVMWADTVLTRLVGLLGRRELAPGAALWISPCKGIHTMGMRFPIDVVFLDKDMRVVALRERVAPWRMTRIVMSASSVLEMAAGSIARTGVAVGDELDFVPAAGRSPRRHSHGLEE